jgi:hypothetical protein
VTKSEPVAVIKRLYSRMTLMEKRCVDCGGAGEDFVDLSSIVNPDRVSLLCFGNLAFYLRVTLCPKCRKERR